MIEAHDFCNGKLIGSIFIGRTDAGTEALIFCLPDLKSQLIREASNAGKD